jgi:hypothetical protein
VSEHVSTYVSRPAGSNHTVPPGRAPFSYPFQALRARLLSHSPSGTKKTILIKLTLMWLKPEV